MTEMKKYGIFYGSTTGVTADVASRLGKILDVAGEDILNVADTAPARLGDYEVLLLGSSTWGSGELQDDWYDFVDGAQALDLKGKKIALFGCGDETLSDTFCGAIGVLRDKLKDTGAEFIGEYPAGCYTFDDSEALTGGDGRMMAGLALDEVNHPDLTDSRLEDWAEKLK